MQSNNPLSLDTLQKTILDALKKDGVFVIHIDELMGKGHFQELQAYADTLSPDAKTMGTKTFYQDLWDYQNLLLDEKNVFLTSHSARPFC